ncbi:polysaccharide biosynthesis/export family protein, partial [bacterium]|nr:polysaccharide biosynthesis/export family protein [bacterium]
MSKFFSSLSISFGLLFASSAFLVAQEEDGANANLREAYVLRPNDVVELSVYEEPDLAKIATILKTGEASFPLIGAVNLKGLS